MNLLEETEQYLEQITSPIIFIGSLETGHSCTWEEFKVLADIEYNSGYGSQNISKDLVIVFSDTSILRRVEYDGSEWWEYVEVPKIPENNKKITTLCNGGMWETLEEMNK